MNVPLHMRVDLQIIADLVPARSRVLDLGCGDGDLLNKLIHEKQVDGSGVELYNEHIYECIAKGVPVIQGNLDEGLYDYPDHSFDYVILSRTLQEVHKPLVTLREMVRIGHVGILSFPNFGYWAGRCQLFFKGQMPVTQALPNPWHSTPNIHLATIRDFLQLCQTEKIEVLERIHIRGRKRSLLAGLWPNLLTEVAIFVIRRA
jgi:methionine biosynthesis protein MetW